jgi:uncharacterized protein
VVTSDGSSFKGKSLNAALEPSRALIQALMDPSAYPHPVTKILVQETHISWVLLTGPFAYKIKKPVDLGFVDFSTLPLRHHACMEELRLNGRMAPHLYLNIIPITGTPEVPKLGGDAEPFEYAVKMRQFPLDATLDHALPKGDVLNRHIDQLAKDLARFHGTLPGTPEPTLFGNPEVIQQTITDILDHFLPEASPTGDHHLLQSLQQWMKQEHAARYQTFANRKRQGFVRECHGDLHLANVVLIEDRATPFDGIEFSERLRWIDVMSDAAFFIMDLRARGRPDFAWRFLNAYLEYTGDYEGIAVLRFYEVYRALVRAKVALIRLHQNQHADETSPSFEEEFHRYINVAHTLTHTVHPNLIIMHGLSGSGKSTFSQALLETMGAIRLRSDIERKRMFGLSPDVPSTKEIKTELYGSDTTETLHYQLRDTAKCLLASGYHVIMDATFLKRRYRDLFRTLAEEAHAPFLILDVQAPPEKLRERIVIRAQQRSDASEADLAVLQQQQRQQEPLEADEQPLTYSVNSEQPFDPQKVIQVLLQKKTE